MISILLFISLGCGPDTNNGDDCNDAADNAYLGATEVCDAIDNNCDGGTDEDGVCDTGGDTGVEDTADTDSGEDTGEEVVVYNCGGPEPNETPTWWICENGTSDLEGETWPAAGPPEDPYNCWTSGGWGYWLSENGKSVTLTRDDGWVLTCELDE